MYIINSSLIPQIKKILKLMTTGSSSGSWNTGPRPAPVLYPCPGHSLTVAAMHFPTPGLRLGHGLLAGRTQQTLRTCVRVSCALSQACAVAQR